MRILSFIQISSFPGGTSDKEPTCQCRSCRRLGLIPGPGRSPGRGHDNPLQYSCQENPTDRGVWQPTVQRVGKSRTQLKWLSMHAHNSSCQLPHKDMNIWRKYISSLFIKLPRVICYLSITILGYRVSRIIIPILHMKKWRPKRWNNNPIITHSMLTIEISNFPSNTLLATWPLNQV